MSSADDDTIEYILPNTDPKEDPGWRIRIRYEPHGLVTLMEERVLPEHVTNPDARAVFEKASIWFTTTDARWIRDRLNEVVELSLANEALVLLREARQNMIGRAFACMPEDEYLMLLARIDALLGK